MLCWYIVLMPPQARQPLPCRAPSRGKELVNWKKGPGANHQMLPSHYFLPFRPHPWPVMDPPPTQPQHGSWRS